MRVLIRLITPDSDFIMRIRFRLCNLMQIRIRIQILASKKGSNPRKSAKMAYMFHTFWFDICKLMRIRVRFRIQLINFDADSDVDFYLMRMRIRIHNTGRHRKGCQKFAFSAVL
jgi:hypothetical protein